MADNGAFVLARTMTVLPPTMMGAIESIKPSKDGVSGAIAAITPHTFRDCEVVIRTSYRVECT